MTLKSCGIQMCPLHDPMSAKCLACRTFLMNHDLNMNPMLECVEGSAMTHVFCYNELFHELQLV